MERTEKMEYLATRKFIPIAGPNPILLPGSADDWDGSAIEACNVIKDADTYYLYYHGWANNADLWKPGYRIGVATAKHPLGPWVKSENNPIIEMGAEGSWDEGWVACASLLKEEKNNFSMLYSGNFGVGLATAEHPLGPWKKYGQNPVIEENFGYVGSVLKVNGLYLLYNEYPIDISPDQGSFALATADRIEGPWRRHEKPVLRPDSFSSWDSGGYSESNVLYHDGVFHTFYAGTKWERQPAEWKSAFESVGYACSMDGKNFFKHVDNPVVPREGSADTSAISEVHALWEAPFYYLYHTLRFISLDVREGYGEYIGMQIVATRTPFRIPFPVISLDELSGGKISPLVHQVGERKRIEVLGCPPIGLSAVQSVAMTATCRFDAGATAGLRIHVKSSTDGDSYDSEDFETFDVLCNPGKTVQRTQTVAANVIYIKVLVENLDAKHRAMDISVTATLCG